MHTRNALFLEPMFRRRQNYGMYHVPPVTSDYQSGYWYGISYWMFSMEWLMIESSNHTDNKGVCIHIRSLQYFTLQKSCAMRTVDPRAFLFLVRVTRQPESI